MKVEKYDEIQEYLLNEYLRANEHSPRGLLIMGDVGVGKSTLLGLIAHFFAKYFCIGARFIPVAMLFQLYFERNYEKISRLMRFNILMLDDLGIEYAHDFPLSMFENFIEYRHGNLLPTFVTTNLKIEDLKKRQGFERIADRFNEQKWMRQFIMAGKSKRG